MRSPRVPLSGQSPSDVVPVAPHSDVGSWWALPVDELLTDLSSDASGLSASEAASRLDTYGPNVLRPREEATRWSLILKQVRSPLVLILVFAAVVSGVVSEWLDAIIIISIVAGSAVLGFFQEYRASGAVAELRARVELKTRVRRGGDVVEAVAADLVPGDVVVLGTGGLVPADGRVLSAVDCHVSEAILTGETFPVEKNTGVVAAETPIAGRANCLWMGTTVRAGTAEMLVVATGARTEYGTVAQHLALLAVTATRNAVSGGELRRPLSGFDPDSACRQRVKSWWPPGGLIETGLSQSGHDHLPAT